MEFAQLLTYETLGKLHYLHAALSETLRLYPAVAVVSMAVVYFYEYRDFSIPYRLGSNYISW